MERKSAVAGLAILAASAFWGTASAADLGGGCCADLEERVAELEATTARKGNRVVSLQISGAVHESLLLWDDGVESDAYIVTNTGYQSRLKFNGEAQINPNLKAGFEIEFGVWGVPSLAVDQTSDESISSSPRAQDNSIFVRQKKLFIQSETFGRITVGQQSVAADNITSINVSQAVHIATPAHQLYMGAFRLRESSTGALSPFRYTTIMGGDGSNQPGDPTRLDSIRYDAKIGGFIASASWGEDDYWDVALRYTGLLFGRMKAGAGIAYSTWSDGEGAPSAVLPLRGGPNNACHVVNGETDCSQVGLSGSLMDIPTGLYIYGAYGVNWDENADVAAAAASALAATTFEANDEDYFWYIQGGIEKKWTPYGATTLFGEYGNYNSGFAFSALSSTVLGAFESAQVEMWGIGINQNFESAALDIYAKFNHYSANVDGGVQINTQTQPPSAAGVGTLEDFHTIYTGARIRF